MPANKLITFVWEDGMSISERPWRVDRRTILKSTAAIAAVQFSSPFIIKARGETPVRIGMVDPLTGVYAAIAQGEVVGAKFATEEINKKGGILGRPVELLIEDFANDVGTGVQKTRKLIERDQVSFIIGDVNSGIAIAIAQVTSEKKVLHIVSGGHTDPITGANCSWNVFRVCNSTTMDANAIAHHADRKIRQKMVLPDAGLCVWTLGAGRLRKGPESRGWHFRRLPRTPRARPDYSSYLIQAKAYSPQVLINVMGGGDQVSSLKQFVQFGLDKQMAVGGALFELESIRAVPDGARVGWWTMEWWWDQPGVPHVAEFNASIKKITGAAATARNWFGYASVQTLALIANQEKTLDAPKLAHALSGFKLPPEVALQPGAPEYRAGDHELMSTVFVGEAHPPKGDPDNMFTCTQPRARRKSRRTGRGYRLQDSVAGLTRNDTGAWCPCTGRK